jgi:hypothetical protein
MFYSYGGQGCKWHLQLRHFLQPVVNAMGPYGLAVM